MANNLLNVSVMSTKAFMSPVCAETDDQQKLRFQVELEFVQCLANPNYINFLAQRGFFKESTFINYLKYLLYWKEQEYARFLKYPMCLYFLDLLQYEHFRREAVNSQCCKFIDDQAILLWQHYTRRRNRMFSIHNGTIQMNPNDQPQGQTPAGGQAPAGNNGQPGGPVTVAPPPPTAPQNNGIGATAPNINQKVP